MHCSDSPTQSGTPDRIPLLSSPVKAGFLSATEGYVESTLDFNNLLIQNHAATYALRVSGSSMIHAGIFSGDLVIVDRSLQPTNGVVVVAEIDGEFTLKRFITTSTGAILHSENPDFPDITVPKGSDLTIWGTVTWVLHRP